MTEIAAGGRPLDKAKMVSRSLTGASSYANNGATSCHPSQIILRAT
jgi:hypothetical protein